MQKTKLSLNLYLNIIKKNIIKKNIIKKNIIKKNIIKKNIIKKNIIKKNKYSKNKILLIFFCLNDIIHKKIQPKIIKNPDYFNLLQPVHFLVNNKKKNNATYNHFFSFFKTSYKIGKIKKTTNSKKKTNKKKTFNQWLFLPLSNFFNNKKFSLITHNLYDTIALDNFNFFIKTALSLFPFLKLNRVATRLVAALQLLLIFKDTEPLLIFIKTTFQSVHYSSHNQYYIFVNYLLQYVVGPQLNSFNCLGVRALFRGKLGVGGNSRKSVQRISYGPLTSSSKFIKIHKTFSPIKTKTGVVGFWLFLTW